MPIYLFSGKIASGKTTISTALANYLGINRYTVSDYLKNYADIYYNGNHSRDTLQKIGDIKRKEGYKKFCIDFLTFINYEKDMSFIIDGIRTIEFLEEMKLCLINEKVIHIFIEIDEKLRHERMLKRNAQDQLYYQHHTENYSRKLMEAADIIVNSNNNVTAIVAYILSKQ